MHETPAVSTWEKICNSSLVVWSLKSLPKKVRFLYRCHCSCALSKNKYSRGNLPHTLRYAETEIYVQIRRMLNSCSFLQQHWKGINVYVSSSWLSLWSHIECKLYCQIVFKSFQSTNTKVKKQQDQLFKNMQQIRPCLSYVGNWEKSYITFTIFIQKGTFRINSTRISI